ncbi:MAG: DUF1385 domain-containing protein [Ruminococcaceae bacterium]|nr:DUF1385 domain-containing protein [Oscillospiraceae bacterium]
MVGGKSSSVGIVFYDTEKKNENAVFCFYKDSEPLFKTGNKNDLFKEMQKLDEPAKREPAIKIFELLAAELLVFIFIIAAVWIFIGGFFPVFGAFLFSALAYFPVLVLIYAVKSLYPAKENLEQFKRFHGAEHIAVGFYLKNKKIPTSEDFKNSSPYHNECGTVYAASAVIFSTVFGTGFALIPEIGFLFFIVILFVTLLLLFLNFFNPFNPLVLFQRYTVSKPSEKEIRLASEGIRILSELE